MSSEKENTDFLPQHRAQAERMDGARELEQGIPQLGQWYWITSRARWDGDFGPGSKKDDTTEWLGCVMQLGSNFVKFQAPAADNATTSIRIHLDELDGRARLEPNHEEVIAKLIERHRSNAHALMDNVRAITARLGLRSTALPDASASHGSGTNALAPLSGAVDIKAHEIALIEAKEKELPELFKAIEKENREMARWMTAPTMPLMATVGPMKGAIKQIEQRVFNISIYAGLTESAVKIADGHPAAIDEKLRVLQRRLYMDEECLLDYQAGGMDIRGLEAFDAWLSQPHNRDRILPIKRCMVAMRVRRNTKDREAFNLREALINLSIDQADKWTFLYIRNGDQLWRIGSEHEFGEMIFPSSTVGSNGYFDPGEPMMIKMFGSRVDDFMPKREYEYLLGQWNELEAKASEWAAANPQQPAFNNPFASSILGGEHRIGDLRFRPSDWKPFDDTNVYYDEAMAALDKVIQEYNRVALIIQGLFDRSEVLHPHLPVKSWTSDGFAQAIELIHDGHRALYHGEPPDFEAYRASCNASLDVGSVTFGQEEFWLKREAQRENAKRRNDWRRRSNECHLERFQPYGDPGPGRLAVVTSWAPRARKAGYMWERRKRGVQSNYGETTPASVTAPATELFNVSAYTPGDFKQFFRDPRTREHYLQWAPMLLAAEDFHAGKIEPGTPTLKNYY